MSAPMRLATFNLLSGRSLADGRIETARLTDAVTALGADVLALQEVDRGQPRSGGVHQTELAARAMGATHWRFTGTVAGTPGEDGWLPATAASAGDHDVPGYGIALLSRLPVLEWHELRLTAARGRYPIPLPARPPQVLWLRDEPRAAVAAVIADPRMTVACTHLSFVPGANVRQLRRVRRWLAELPGPRLLLGDLNMPAALARRATGWTPLVSAPTFPAPAPRTQLDHVLADALPPGSRAQGRVEEMDISDHRAVVIDLAIGPVPTVALTSGGGSEVTTGSATAPGPSRRAGRPAGRSRPSPRRRTPR